MCDELGLNITSSEHHAGINCLYGASPVVLGIVARQTRNIRLFSMGTLVTVRQDPVRAAEEYATADVISRGRLEIGFVKSGGTEMASGNANPIGVRERFWEAIDLIGKTLTTHDGPFSWEGKHFTHRHVNIWPRPYQDPHPPMWAATSDPVDTAELGRRGMVNIMVMRGVDVTKRAWGVVSPGARRGRTVEAGDRPLWLFRLCLCRRHRRGGRARRLQVIVVRQHQHEIGAAIRQVPARHRPRPNSRRSFTATPEPPPVSGGRDGIRR